MIPIFPSLISADLMKLGEEITFLEPHVAGFHIDVMDFQFVPNLTWGFAFIKAISSATNKQLHVHLIVDYPESYLDHLHLQKGDIISIHAESKTNQNVGDILNAIAHRGWIASLALSPATPITILKELPALQHVLLMTVEPGFSGQELIPGMLDKLTALTEYRRAANRTFTIAVDGGITAENCHELIARGADQLSIASAIFSHADRIGALNSLKDRF